MGFPSGLDGKESAYNTGDRFNPWVQKIPLRREWQPTLVFLPGESHGQRSLVGYSPWGCNESDTTETLTLSLSLSMVEEVLNFISTRQWGRKGTKEIQLTNILGQ